jgi:hypothetical protein
MEMAAGSSSTMLATAWSSARLVGLYFFFGVIWRGGMLVLILRVGEKFEMLRALKLRCIPFGIEAELKRLAVTGPLIDRGRAYEDTSERSGEGELRRADLTEGALGNGGRFFAICKTGILDEW